MTMYIGAVCFIVFDLGYLVAKNSRPLWGPSDLFILVGMGIIGAAGGPFVRAQMRRGAEFGEAWKRRKNGL